MNNNEKAAGLATFFTLFILVSSICKLLGLNNWDWWFIFSPVIVAISVLVIIFTVIAIYSFWNVIFSKFN